MVEAEYAKAVHELALEENKVDLFWDQFSVVSTTADDQDFKRIMASPTIEKKAKRDIVAKVYKNLDPTFLDFLYVLVDHDRFYLIDEIGHEYRKLVRNDKNIMFIDVISAEELTKAQTEKLNKSLEAKFAGKTLQYKYIVKPNLIGGIQIISNGESIDMSLKTSLERIKEEL